MSAKDQANDESEAVVLYVGWKLTPYPQYDPERLIARFGEAHGLDLVQYSQRVLNDLGEHKPDFEHEDLAGAVARMTRAIAHHHPELSDDALAALAWCYSWGYK